MSFDRFGADEIQIRPSLGATWQGRPVADVAPAAVMEALTAKGGDPKWNPKGMVESDKLAITFEFNDDGTLSQVFMSRSADAEKPRRWWQFWK